MSRSQVLDTLEKRLDLMRLSRLVQRAEDARDFLPVNDCADCDQGDGCDAWSPEARRAAIEARKRGGGSQHRLLPFGGSTNKPEAKAKESSPHEQKRLAAAQKLARCRATALRGL